MTTHLVSMPPDDLVEELYASELELRYRVLREPIGMTRQQVCSPIEGECHHVLVVDGERVVGCVLLHLEGLNSDGESAARLLQMAVSDELQGRGEGRRLVGALERLARHHGVQRVTLHARQNAIGFYERLGYEQFGEPFSEVGIPHRMMGRLLS